MRSFLLTIAVLLGSCPALATTWKVDPVTSRLMFEGEQAGEKFAGAFKIFTAAIDFDAATPAKGSIAITVDMHSVEVDGKDRMEALPTTDWFASKQFPQATFTSNHIRATGTKHDYIANGTLTLRGIQRTVDLPFTLSIDGKTATAKGSLTLNRSEFGIGQGQWKSDEWVKFLVTVRFEIYATSGG